MEYKGFIVTARISSGRWIATIRKSDGSPLIVDLLGNKGPKQSLDTSPPARTKDAALTLAIDAIDGGSIH